MSNGLGDSWAQAATALFVLLGFICQIILQLMLRRDAKETIKKTTEVKAAVIKTQAVQVAKIEELAAKVEVIHKETNSMKDALLVKTEAEALARGGAEERARADAERKEAKDAGAS